MSTRNLLLNEVQTLRQVVIKEWFKQAFFRKEKQIEYTLIIEELQNINSLIQGQLSSQEELISPNLEDSDEPEAYTPRFLSSNPPRYDQSSQFTFLFKSLSGVKSLLQQLFENERVIFSRIQSPEAPFDGNLTEKLEKEREKLNKLTKKYNDLSLDFLKLNETLEDLRYQREQGCDNCVLLKDKIDELEDQLSHPNEEIQRVKQMYEELKQAHDQIADELRMPDEDYQEDKNDREDALRQLNYMQDIQKKLELGNAELVKKIQSEENTIKKLNEIIEDCEDEIKKKNASLDKAQGIIKKLNQECEKLAKDLERVEIENEGLKKENRSLCKTKTGVDKKRNELEVMKKTEERLREDLSGWKNKWNSAVERYEIQINHLNGLLTKQSQEKNNLEITLEELEQKLGEIEVVNRKRLDEFSQTALKVQDLEEVIKKKDEELEKANFDLDRIVANKDQEFQHLKRQAENMIRHLNTSQNTTKSAKVEKKAAEIGQTSLAEQLNEALLREQQLKNLITDLTNQEGKALKDYLSNFNKVSAHCRAETERWIMRNEELEQRLLDSVDKNARFIGTVKDLQKMLQFKTQQFEEYLKNSENNSKELLSKNEFLQLELTNLYNLISRDIFPQSQKLINQALSESHEKIHSLRQEVAELRERIVSDEEELMRQQQIAQGLIEEKESISKLLYRANASIIFIEKHLGEVLPLSQTPEVPEIDVLSEVTDKARFISEKIVILKDNQQQYQDKLLNVQIELMHTQKAFSDQSEIHKLLEKSCEKLQDENRYLTKIAYKEKEEKIKLKSVMSFLQKNSWGAEEHRKTSKANKSNN